MNNIFTSRAILYYIISIGFTFLLSCGEIKDNEVEPNQSFNKVYNSKIPDANIYPMDIKQTLDGGYLVLSEFSDLRVRLLKVDKTGEVKIDTLLSEELVSPFQTLTKVENGFIFFCMDKGGQAMAVKVPQDTLSGLEIIPLAISNPLSIGNTSDNGFIVQHWNRKDKKTFVSKLSPSLTVTASNEFDMFEEMGNYIDDHNLRTGNRLPFLSGSLLNNKFYFNGYYNYNFGLVFLDANLDIIGNIAGNKTHTYVTSIESLNTNKYAISTSTYKENFFGSNTEMEVTNSGVVQDIKLNYMPEMASEIPIITKQVSLNGVKIILCGFTTKTKQIALYGYKIETGELLGKHIIGNTNPYEIGNFTETEDKGLVVLAKTYVAGQFPREAIIKFSNEEFLNMFPIK